MEKRTGIGFPKFACEINKYRDVWNCLRERAICPGQNWLVDRYNNCMITENKNQTEKMTAGSPEIVLLDEEIQFKQLKS
jgi:hypothetical protein